MFPLPKGRLDNIFYQSWNFKQKQNEKGIKNGYFRATYSENSVRGLIEPHFGARNSNMTSLNEQTDPISKIIELSVSAWVGPVC